MPAQRRGVGVRAEVVSIAVMAALLVVVVTLTATIGEGSAGSGRDDGVTPLGRIGAGGAATPREAPGPAVDRPRAGGSPSPTETNPSPGSEEDAVPAALDDLLVRFDAALTALSAEPMAAVDATHPLVLGWHAAVAEGSELDEELRRRVVTGLADRSMVVHPPPDGGSFRTLALDAVEEPDGSIRFTHCGYSPGVGTDAATGEVLDDRRASTRGTGRAEVVDGTLVLVELRDEERVLLDPGEPDPCPGLRAEAGAGDGP